MTTLTNSDFQSIKQWIRTKPTHKATFKTWGLSKADYKAMFQAIEDYEVNAFSSIPTTSIKVAIDVAITGTSTNGQAKQALDAWAAWYNRNI